MNSGNDYSKDRDEIGVITVLERDGEIPSDPSAPSPTEEENAVKIIPIITNYLLNNP